MQVCLPVHCPEPVRAQLRHVLVRPVPRVGQRPGAVPRRPGAAGAGAVDPARHPALPAPAPPHPVPARPPRPCRAPEDNPEGGAQRLHATRPGLQGVSCI